MDNIIHMINRNLGKPISKLPTFENWEELGEDGQNLIAVLALNLTNEELQKLRDTATNDNNVNSSWVLWNNLKDLEEVKNAEVKTVQYFDYNPI